MKTTIRELGMLFAGALLWSALPAVTPATQSAPVIEWIDDNYEDFRAGQFDASGQNLFVTRKGQVKTVSRFDLNTDGYLDLVFSTSHDFVTAPPPTLYEIPGGRQAGNQLCGGCLPEQGRFSGFGTYVERQLDWRRTLSLRSLGRDRWLVFEADDEPVDPGTARSQSGRLRR